MNITAHCIVQNEDQWIWFAIQSVLPFCKQILVFDTGSSDKTVDIIKLIKSPKVIFEEKGVVDAKGLVALRQEQIDRTQTEWFLILDGDEIWPNNQIKKLLRKAEQAPSKIVAVFNQVRNCEGDVFHYLPESAGRYEIAGVRGNLNIRLIRKVEDLRVEGKYPLESYIDKGGPIEKQDQKLIFGDFWYLHTTFLQRSSGEVKKTSGSFGRSKFWEKGIRLADSELPEVFFKPRPEVVDNPLKKRGVLHEILSQITTPILKVKRLFK